MPSKSHLSTYIKWNIFILVTIAASSLGQLHDRKSSSACKSVLLEDCDRDDCLVDIFVIDKCPPDYADAKTKEKCENILDRNLLEDNFQFIPVTKVQEKITYWNIYCADCHNETVDEKKFVFSTLAIYYKSLDDDFKPKFGPNKMKDHSSFIYDVDPAVLEEIQVDHDGKLILTSSKFGGTVLPLRQLPSRLKISSHERCPSNPPEKKQSRDRINRNLRLSALDDFNCHGKNRCSKKKLPRPNKCIYLDKYNNPCRANDFLEEKIGFLYREHDKILLKNGRMFDSDMYVNLDNRQIFFCGSNAKDFENCILQLLHESSKYMRYVSILLLVVFLAMKTNKKNFKSLPELILYSYCLISLVLYLYQIFGYLMEYNTIWKIYVMLYIYLCYACWTLIISYEYWKLISASLKLQRPNMKMKKYYIYGFIGWILPGLLLTAGFQFLNEEDKSFNCPNLLKLGMKNQNMFHSFSDLPRYVHWGIIAMFILSFIILIPFLIVQVCYSRHLVQHGRDFAKRNAEGTSQATRSISESGYMIIFTKIACLMGFQWMVILISVLLSALVESIVISVLVDIGSFLFSCHGIFLFRAFGWKEVPGLCRKIRESFKSLVTRDSSV